MTENLPNSVTDLFDRDEYTYSCSTYESMNNYASMDYFLDCVGAWDYVIAHEGTQVILFHPDFSFELQIDAGGFGDFFSHKFDVICLSP